MTAAPLFDTLAAALVVAPAGLCTSRAATPRSARRSVRQVLWAAGLLAGLQAGPAQATTEVVLQLESSMRSDSNPLRFTRDANVQQALGTDRQSDSVLANDVRGAVILPLDSPETRVLLTGQLGRRNYSNLSQLNDTEGAYKAALQWRLGPLWRGEAYLSQDQQLYRYLDGSLTSREMTHTSTASAEVALRMTPDLELPLLVRQRHVRYDTPVNLVFESEERVVDAGVRYRTGTQSSMQLGLRSSQVSFPQRTEAQIASLDSQYRDLEAYAEADWQYSVFSRLGGRIASLHRNYQSLSARNFSVLTTELRLVYDYSPLTRLTLDLWKRPYGTTDTNTLYTLITGAQLGARWQASPKTRVTLQAVDERQRYQSSALASGQLNPELNRVRWGGGVVYALSRDVRLFVDGFKERLDRGTLGAGIDQTVVRMGVEYTYENLDGVAQRVGLGERR